MCLAVLLVVDCACLLWCVGVCLWLLVCLCLFVGLCVLVLGLSVVYDCWMLS